MLKKIRDQLKLMRTIYKGGRPRRGGRPWKSNFGWGKPGGGNWQSYHSLCSHKFWWYKWGKFIEEDVGWTLKRWFVKRPKDALYWFRYRFVTRFKYNQVRPRTLKPNYYDQSDRILHAAFELLVDYVEENSGRFNYGRKNKKKTPLSTMTKKDIANSFFALCCDDDNPVHGVQLEDGDREFEEFGSTTQEIINLYVWWTRERIEFIDVTVEEIEVDGKDYCEEEDKASEKDVEMLARLAKIHKHLWV